MNTMDKQSYFRKQEQSEVIRLKSLCDAEIIQMESSVRYPDSALRALALRIYCGFGGHGKQKQFARWLSPGISAARWGMIERGQTQFSSRMIEVILVKLPDLTDGWLRRGERRGIPPELMTKLDHILAELRNGKSLAS